MIPGSINPLRNTVANLQGTQEEESCWRFLDLDDSTCCARRHARKRLEIKKDVELACQEILGAAHSVAYTEIIRIGKVCEEDVIYRAVEANPALFQTIYLDVLAKRKNRKVLAAADSDRIDAYLDQNYKAHLKPLLSYLKKEKRVVPLSEISDNFAFSEVYPCHLESACEWLESKGRLQKLSAPFKLTKRSLEQVEEPAYFLGRVTVYANNDRGAGSP